MFISVKIVDYLKVMVIVRVVMGRMFIGLDFHMRVNYYFRNYYP